MQHGYSTHKSTQTDNGMTEDQKTNNIYITHHRKPKTK